MTETKRDASFSLGNLFGGKGLTAAPAASLEPHPSVRPHISPLNRLAVASTADDELPVHPDVRSGVLDNGLPYIILPNRSPPGRFEAHLQVFSGSGTLFPVYTLASIGSIAMYLTHSILLLPFSR
jgi:hypothetical protein